MADRRLYRVTLQNAEKSHEQKRVFVIAFTMEAAMKLALEQIGRNYELAQFDWVGVEKAEGVFELA